MTGFAQADIDKLGELLDALDALVEASGEEDVSAPLVGQVDGFLTALVVSTEQVPQDEWFVALFPGIERVMPAETVEELTALVLARKAHIVGELRRGEAVFEPIYEIDENDDTLWEFWIEGFDRAMQLRLPAWEALGESEDERLAEAFGILVIMVLLARDVQPETEEEEDIAEGAPDIIPIVSEVLYCRQRAIATVLDEERQEPVRVEQIGRNDPCPCGSGKKFKKCCLA